MMPLLMTTVMTLVPAARRGVMMGNISIVISVAPALGPTLSGFIIGRFGWRGIFLVVLPIALAHPRAGRPVAGLGLRDLTGPGRPAVGAARRARLRWPGLRDGQHRRGGRRAVRPSRSGCCSSSAASACCSSSCGRSCCSARTAPCWTCGSSGRRCSPSRWAPCCSRPGRCSARSSSSPLFAQRGLGLDPLQTGLITLPGGLMMGLASPFVGRIYDAHGPRVLLVPGVLLISSTLWVLDHGERDHADGAAGRHQHRPHGGSRRHVHPADDVRPRLAAAPALLRTAARCWAPSSRWRPRPARPSSSPWSPSPRRRRAATRRRPPGRSRACGRRSWSPRSSPCSCVPAVLLVRKPVSVTPAGVLTH